MGERIAKLIEPEKTLPEMRKIFSNRDLKALIVPLFMEQLLAVLVGVADTFMVSYAGVAGVAFPSLIDRALSAVVIRLSFQKGLRMVYFSLL